MTHHYNYSQHILKRDMDKRRMTVGSATEWNYALLQQGKFSINPQENMVNSKVIRTRSGFIVASVGSGSGKISLVLAILATLKDLGIKVASFKAVPDFNRSTLVL